MIKSCIWLGNLQETSCMQLDFVPASVGIPNYKSQAPIRPYSILDTLIHSDIAYIRS